MPMDRFKGEEMKKKRKRKKKSDHLTGLSILRPRPDDELQREGG